MRKISSWAKRYPWRARLSITVLYLLINITGLITGDLLFSLHILLPGSFLLTAIILFTVTVFCYPDKRIAEKGVSGSLYAKRKICDLLLITSTFLMICFTGNQTNLATPYFPFTAKTAGVSPAAYSLPELPIKPASNSPSKKFNKKQVRKNLLHLVQQIRKSYKTRTQGEKIALVILTVFIAVQLIGILSILACSIACGGAEALAYVVLFGGTAAIIFFSVRIIQRILRGKQQSQPGSTPTP